MAIRVYKVADIIENHVVCSPQRKYKQTEVTAVLTNLQPVADPHSDCSWTLGLEIGEGPGARQIQIDIPPFVGKSTPVDVPVLLREDDAVALYYFQDHLFMPERSPRSAASEQHEVALRIKKAVYDEEFELSSLRAAVANLARSMHDGG